MTKQAFALEVSVDDKTGGMVARVLACPGGSSGRDHGSAEGIAYAYYDDGGLLLGLELLGPCQVAVFDRLGQSEPDPIKRFLKAPRRGNSSVHRVELHFATTPLRRGSPADTHARPAGVVGINNADVIHARFRQRRLHARIGRGAIHVVVRRDDLAVRVVQRQKRIQRRTKRAANTSITTCCPAWPSKRNTSTSWF